MSAPPGIARFDSASAMALALARFLEGRDFAGLGQSPLLQAVARQADWVPRPIRERFFAWLGAREGVSRRQVGDISMVRVAAWLTGLYPQRRYPAIMIGSSNGALVHVAAALGIPWLPQTLLTLVDEQSVHPDDARGALRAEKETALRFVAANPGSQLHHLHDPSQDRLMLSLIAYYRSKYLVLPPAYREFVERCLEPGGTVYIVECERRWSTTRVADRYVYQFGAVGGPTLDEYFRGSPRVADYLQRYGSPIRRWEPPDADESSPEAEWGFAPALRDDIVALARDRGYRVRRIVFEDPEHPSGLVADLYRAWYRQRGLPDGRLAIESFVLHEPLGVLRTASVPYWMTFNMQPSLDAVSRYLDGTEPYDEIHLMLFAHGVDSVGLPPIEAWQRLLLRARRRGAFLGLRPRTYPAHFAHFARYSQELLRQAGAHHPLPPPLSTDDVERFIERHGAAHGVRLLAA